VCHARLNKKIVRVLFGFRLRLGVRDSVGGPETLDKLLTEPVPPVCGSNPRSTSYARMPVQNRTAVRP
jgi:hypothetical protein